MAACSWNRSGIAIVVRGNGTFIHGCLNQKHPKSCMEDELYERGDLAWDTIAACPNDAGADTEWCADHKCEAKGCDNARVAGAVCVGHQPGSLRMAREARQAASPAGLE